MKRLEPIAYAMLILLFSGLVFAEGRRQQELTTRIELTPKALYQQLARSQVRLQIVDAREEGFEDSHIPGAIPFPACDPSAASEWVLASVPSVIVTSDGDAATFARCRGYFTTVRNLEGGFTAWDDASYPEDEGEYAPPHSSAGGGCL